ncbi:MAG: hypothetical protein JNK05_27950 [Myxococcales bacterium]|nr:hypothetical protein [Myxococcales bacterium]
MKYSERFQPGPTALAWVGNALSHPDPLRPVDDGAAAHLYEVLAKEALALRELSSSIAAVGSSPSKFNDAGDAAWRFARVDRASYNDDGYGAAPAYRAGSVEGPLDRALEVLDRLDRAGWRAQWSKAFGEWFYDSFLVLMVQDGAPWLLYCTSNAGERDHAFSLWQEERLVYFGETLGRMDERLPGDDEPLAFIPSNVDWADRWMY